MKIHFLCARLAVVSLAMTLFLASCALSGFVTVPRRTPFDESKFAAYGGLGSGTVAGHLMVTSSDGVTHSGSAGGGVDGIHVTLIPVTAYTKEMVEREIGNGENLSASDPRFQKYVRLTTTDSNGNFVFHQIRAGEYFVSGLGEWMTGDDYQYQWACERVRVGNGQTVRIRLSHNPQHPGSPTLVLWALE
jgi:hypothetical protein